MLNQVSTYMHDNPTNSIHDTKSKFTTEMVRDDPKLLGDSGEVLISEWSVGGLIPIVKSIFYLTETTTLNRIFSV